MNGYSIMPWVQHLPTVDDSILAMLNSIEQKLCEAEALASRATAIRGGVYLECLHLESVIRNHWTDDHICEAKRRCKQDLQD